MSNTKCTLLGCRYDEVYRSLERMRADFKTVQDGAIELAQELNSRIAKLETELRYVKGFLNGDWIAIDEVD